MRVKTWREIREQAYPWNIYDFNVWVYVHTGFWPYDFPSQIKNYIFSLYKISLALFYSSTVCFFVADAYLARNDMEKLSFNMSSSFLVYLTDIKMVLLMRERKPFEEILESLDNDFDLETVGKSTEDKDIFRKGAAHLVKISKLFYSSLIFIYPLRIISNTAWGSKSYIIPIPFSDILDPYYGWLYTHQVIVSGHFLITVIAHDMLIYGVIIRFSSHFEILAKNLTKIKKLYPRKDYGKYVPGYEESERERNPVTDILICKMNGLDKIQILLKQYGFEKLDAIRRDKKIDADEKTLEIFKECIVHHQKLLREIKKFGLLYSEALLIQAGGAVLLIGIVALHIIFSEETANTLYDLPWYDMNMENRRTLVFILKNLVKGPKFRGGGMVTINRETYLKLLQTSYNMVAVLKNGY